MSRMLLIEEVDLDLIDIEILTERNSKEKKYIIKGPFIESNIKNKNGRVYPGPIVEAEVNKYQDVIKKGRSVGELNHPNSLEIDPKNISHRITKLEFVDKNIVLGEAQIGSGPPGQIVRHLMDDGIKLAVSSRGAGTLKNGIVQKDYKYITNDIVWDPSAPSAFVENIIETKSEWVLENNILMEKDLDDIKSKLNNFGRKKLDKVIASVFEEALEKIVGKFN